MCSLRLWASLPGGAGSAHWFSTGGLPSAQARQGPRQKGRLDISWQGLKCRGRKREHERGVRGGALELACCGTSLHAACRGRALSAGRPHAWFGGQGPPTGGKIGWPAAQRAKDKVEKGGRQQNGVGWNKTGRKEAGGQRALAAVNPNQNWCAAARGGTEQGGVHFREGGGRGRVGFLGAV